MSSATNPQQTELGVTVLLTKELDWIQRKSIGLITNHTGVDNNLQSNYRLSQKFGVANSPLFFARAWPLGRGPRRYRVNSIDTPNGNINVPVFSLYGQSMRSNSKPT